MSTDCKETTQKTEKDIGKEVFKRIIEKGFLDNYQKSKDLRKSLPRSNPLLT